jgi:hypothetical protein
MDEFTPPPDDTLWWVLEKIVRANEKRILGLASQGRYVAIAFEPRRAEEVATSLGWNGRDSLFTVPGTAISECSTRSPMWGRWCASSPHAEQAKVFLVIRDGTFLASHTPEHGWYVEGERPRASYLDLEFPATEERNRQAHAQQRPPDTR